MSTRQRFKDERQVPSATKQIYGYGTTNCANAPVWNLNATVSRYEENGSYSTMVDTVTRNFAKRRKAGEVFFSPMSMQSVKIYNSSGVIPQFGQVTPFCVGSPNEYWWGRRDTFVNCTLGGTTSGFRFNVLPSGAITPPARLCTQGDLDSLVSEVSTSVLNKRARAKQNLYETVAEVHKSTSLLSDTLGSALKVISRKGDLLRRAKDAGSAYLAYRYGLKPIMMDIEGICSGLTKDVGVKRVTSRESENLLFSQLSTSSVVLNEDGMAQLQAVRSFNVTDQYEVRAMSLDEYYASMTHNIGFADKGLITLPWELLPYSFVVDWFVNVGDFIGALVPTPNVRALGSCVVIDRVYRNEYTVDQTGPSNPQYTHTPSRGTHTYEYHERTRAPGLPPPRITVKADFRLDQLTRAADSVALIVQRLKRG